METIVSNIHLISALAIVSVLVFLIVGYLHTLFTNGRVEVGPMQAFVYKNLWTGTPYALRMGSWLIWPGIHKVLVPDISLKNEPFDPDIINTVTANGVEVGIDLVAYTFQVMNESNPALLVPDPIVRVSTEIDYAKRQALVLDRIEAETQAALKGYSLNDLLVRASAGQASRVDQAVLNGISDSINQKLAENVAVPWGIRVEVKLEDIDFPGKVRETFEEMETAERKGKALATKIEQLRGQDPEVVKWLMVADALAPTLRSVFGKKEG